MIGRKILFILFTIVLCIGCDQITKDMVKAHLPRTRPLVLMKGVLSLDYVENKGGVFALEWLLPETWRGEKVTIGVAAILGLIVFFLILTPGFRVFTLLGLSLFCGGSLSNLIDRITLGGVVDFLNFGFAGLRFYIFNLADIAIGVGILITMLSCVPKFCKR